MKSPVFSSFFVILNPIGPHWTPLDPIGPGPNHSYMVCFLSLTISVIDGAVQNLETRLAESLAEDPGKWVKIISFYRFFWFLCVFLMVF